MASRSDPPRALDATTFDFFRLPDINKPAYEHFHHTVEESGMVETLVQDQDDVLTRDEPLARK